MGGHPFPEIRCTICVNPVDLSIDLCADETGAAIHEGCYVNRLTTERSIKSLIEQLLDTLSAGPAALYCAKCHAPSSYVSATFFSESGAARIIRLPVCKNCDHLPTTYAA